MVRGPGFLITAVENGRFRTTSVWCGSFHSSIDRVPGLGTFRYALSISSGPGFRHPHASTPYPTGWGDSQSTTNIKARSVPADGQDSGASASVDEGLDVEEANYESSLPSTLDVGSGEDVPPALTGRASRELAWAGSAPTGAVSSSTSSRGRAHDVLMAAADK